jgi:AraC-like DNA-binding protein
MGDPWASWCEGLAQPGSRLDWHLVGRSQCAAHWLIPLRRLPEHLIYLTMRGDIAATIDGEQLVIPARSALWLPPGTDHHFRNADPSRPVCLHHWRFSVDLPPPCNRMLLTTSAEELLPLAEQVHDVYHHQPALRTLRLRLALAGFFTLWADLETREHQQGGLDAGQRRRIYDWLSQHIHHDPTPADLAELVGLSPTWFTRRFKRSFGRTPRTWLKEQRIRATAARLETGDEEIGVIAAIFGYSDIFAFSKQFRAVMGLSPSAHRRHALSRAD